jgi:hypothetical protein
MLISTTTDVVSSLGSVSGVLFSDILPYLYIIFGFAIAFWITEVLIGIMFYEGDFGHVVDYTFKPKWKGYKWYRSKKWNIEHLDI